MNKKYIFPIIFIIALLAALVLAVTGDGSPSAVTPTTGQNLSGTVILNATNSTTGEAGVYRTTNISFLWNSSATTVALTSRVHNTSLNWSLGNASNTSFDTTLLDDGQYNLTIYFGNYSGNISGHTSVYNLTIDNTPPNVTNVSPSTGDAYTNITGLNITFNATILDALSGVNYTIFEFDNATGNVFNVTGTNFSSGFWNISYNVSTLFGGTHSVRIIAVDYAGSVNRTETVTSFTVNNAPNVTLINTTPTNQNYTVASSNQTFNVSVSNRTTFSNITHVIFMFDNASGNDFNITTTESATLISPNWYWSASYNVSTLTEGSHSVTVFANDTFGNYNITEAFTFTHDNTGPTITVTCTESPTVGVTVTCTCTASDGGSGVKTGPYFQDGRDSNSQEKLADSTGAKTSDTCTATDHAGNVGSGTGSYTVVAAASSGGGGSGGSGGGTSAGVSGSYEKKVWTSINAGEAASVPVKNGAIGVTEVSFDVSKKAYGAWVQVKKRDSFPSTVKSFGKKTYRNLEITKSSTLKDDIISNPKVDFKVEKKWLSDNGIDKSNVGLFRYVDGEWTALPTTVGQDDGTYVKYSATTPGFSYFVIGESTTAAAPTPEADAEDATEPAAEAAPGEEPTEEPAASEDAKKPAWPWVVVAIIIIVAVLIYYMKKR